MEDKIKSLQSIQRTKILINETDLALEDTKRTIAASSIFEALDKALIGVLVVTSPIVGIPLMLRKVEQIRQEKERLLQKAIEKQHTIIVALKEDVSQTKERADYLNRLNILLQQAIKDLQADLGRGV